MKTIVLAFDDSAEAGRALDRTAELARDLGARVLVVSVAPAFHFAGHGVGPYDPADPPSRYRELAAEAVERLQESGVEAAYVTELGDAGSTIVDVADDKGADLIVLGMSHHPHLSRVLGGVGDAVAHGAHCDVLLVH
jgi:nucleotide-binding universal stress UspA family protein